MENEAVHAAFKNQNSETHGCNEIDVFLKPEHG